MDEKYNVMGEMVAEFNNGKIKFEELKLAYLKEYIAWQNRLKLTTQECHSSYMSYGGRGIKVCPQWRPDGTHKGSHDAFIQFLKDIGPAPSPSHQVDRIDNDGDYEPNNVRWVTKTVQMRNRRNTARINGRPFIELCEEAGIAYQKAFKRYYRFGWSLVDALATK